MTVLVPRHFRALGIEEVIFRSEKKKWKASEAVYPKPPELKASKMLILDYCSLCCEG